MRELEAQLRERQALVEALHSKNCMLTILNSNLLMRLDALRSLALAPTASPSSLHLRISLPGACPLRNQGSYANFRSPGGTCCRFLPGTCCGKRAGCAWRKAR